MSRLWVHSITVTRYGEEQRSDTNRIIAPASAEPITIPRCFIQAYKKSITGFQIPEGRKREDYIVYSGPTQLLASDHINEKRKPDTFEWEGYSYSVVHSIPLRGRQRTDGYYAIAQLIDNNTRNNP